MGFRRVELDLEGMSNQDDLAIYTAKRVYSRFLFLQRFSSASKKNVPYPKKNFPFTRKNFKVSIVTFFSHEFG